MGAYSTTFGRSDTLTRGKEATDIAFSVVLFKNYKIEGYIVLYCDIPRLKKGKEVRQTSNLSLKGFEGTQSANRDRSGSNSGSNF